MVFFDTNIFLYAGSKRAEDREKKVVASDLLLSSSFVISTQVVQEYVSNVLTKPKLGLDESNISDFLITLEEENVISVTLDLIVSGIALRHRHQLSHWDSTIVAAALETGCSTLYSEDLNHGQKYDGVQVINPFLSM